jgi:hypothetical protein
MTIHTHARPPDRLCKTHSLSEGGACGAKGEQAARSGARPPDSASAVPPSHAGPSVQAASSACARLTRRDPPPPLCARARTDDPHEDLPDTIAPPARLPGPPRRPAGGAPPSSGAGALGGRIMSGSTACTGPRLAPLESPRPLPVARLSRTAAAACCSGCGCWRARLNQGAPLTQRPCARRRPSEPSSSWLRCSRNTGGLHVDLVLVVCAEQRCHSGQWSLSGPRAARKP